MKVEVPSKLIQFSFTSKLWMGTMWIEDKVWGIFKTDNQTRQMWDLMQTTLQKHNLKTDIVYEYREFSLPTQYQNI